jgi:NADH:ubiquinone oxidoreductase subunit 2 (subunit N)
MRVVVAMYMRTTELPTPSRFPAVVSAALVLAALVTLFGGIFPGAVAQWTVAP